MICFWGQAFWCKGCLLSVVEFAYRPYISFDENTELTDLPEGSVAVKFVDAWFVFNSVDNTIDVIPVNPKCAIFHHRQSRLTEEVSMPSGRVSVGEAKSYNIIGGIMRQSGAPPAIRGCRGQCSPVASV